MTMQAGIADTACPTCHAPNAVGAKFCGACGAAMQAGQGFTPPPPPLPPPPFANSRFGVGGMSGISADSFQWTAPMPQAQALDLVSRVLTATGGRVLAQLSPSDVQIEVPYKDFLTTGGMKVGYRGVLHFAPQGAQQTLLQSKLSLDWNSAVWVLALPMMCAVVAGMSSQYFFMMWVIFGAFATAVGAWALSSMGPRKAGEKLVAALASGVGQSAAPPAQPQNLNAVRPTAPPPSSTAPAAQAASPSPIEQLERLAKLRDAGVVTGEEFDRKKAEILARL